MITSMRTRLLAALVLVVVGAAIVPAAPSGAATKAGSGCRRGAVAGVTTEHLSVDGADRAYLLSIPESYDPSKRAPLILNFHGLGSNKEEQAIYSGMNQKAGA